MNLSKQEKEDFKRNFKERKLDLSCLEKDPNFFEIVDKDGKIICNSCEEYQSINFSGGLKEGDKATYYFIGMSESSYFKDVQRPFEFHIDGTPSWEILMFLRKKGLTVRGAFVLYLRMCEDCMNELEELAIGNTNYKRTAMTECSFCKEK